MPSEVTLPAGCEIVIRKSAELSTPELYAILSLRSEVFVVEQMIPYLDMDEIDLAPDTVHLFIASGSDIVSYLRDFPDENDHEAAHIGRVCTDSSWRGKGLAGALLLAALGHLPAVRTRLNAQAYLKEWYESFGFSQDGPAFDEIGISHIPMVRAEERPEKAGS